MNPISEVLEIEEFDREYSLEDLLPIPMAQALLGEMDGCPNASVLLPDGRVYVGQKPTPLDNQSHFNGLARNNSSEPIFLTEGDHHILLFPLVHEVETMGFLALDFDEDLAVDTRFVSLSRLAARAINRMIYLNYQKRMTAGLHGQVVTDSYNRLKQKTARLAQSEEKYRLLAENLEVEVERKTREIKANQLLLLQQEKMAAIGQLASGMAHEINNPVGFVISNLNTLRANIRDMGHLIGHYNRLTQLLSGKPSGPETANRIKEQLTALDDLCNEIDIDYVIKDADSLIDESLDGAQRVKIIVQNMRDFTHPSIDTAESTDINKCLEITLAVLSSYLSDDIVIKRDYGDIPHVHCHLREMNQAFFNILKNALQAVGDGGEIRICTRHDHHVVTVVITDSGPGIDATSLGRIFDPFFTTREVGSGTGLGLTQAHNTLKSHGGTIAAESTPGKGSTFTITIPIDAIEK